MHESFGVHESKQEVTKVVSPIKMVKIYLVDLDPIISQIIA